MEKYLRNAVNAPNESASNVECDMIRHEIDILYVPKPKTKTKAYLNYIQSSGRVKNLRH